MATNSKKQEKLIKTTNKKAPEDGKNGVDRWTSNGYGIFAIDTKNKKKK